MEIITTHMFSDLDSIASMIIAKKLYPDAKIILPSTLGTSVKKLISLYGNILDFYSADEIELSSVKKIILVDTSSSNRISPFNNILNSVEVIIYDHHPDSECNFKHRREPLLENYGSNTSFMLDIYLKKYGHLSLAPHELDICLLGIYEDTGSFYYPTTSYKDFQMASLLLKEGSNLEIIKDFIRLPLSPEQKIVLETLLSNSETIYLGKDSVVISTFDSDSFATGLNEVIDRVVEETRCSACFLIAKSKKKISIIGRSSTQNIKLEKILKNFTGGGHWSAYAAIYPGDSIEDAKKEVISNLKDFYKNEKTAKDIMSFPVKTLRSDLTLREAYLLIERTGYNGFPVAKDNFLLGIISRRELAKLVNHGLGNSLVEKYMDKEVITASPSTPLSTLKDIFVENDIGRLPIVENNKLLGIVTKTDILNSLYTKKYSKENAYFTLEPHILNMNIFKFFPKEIQNIFVKIQEISQQRGEKAYLVGGIVRDILLDIPNEDIDIVVSKNGIEFAKELFNCLPSAKLTLHEKFNTANLFLENGIIIDIATLRSEYYEYPTALPTVTEGTIKDDLFRRDFTINALAIELNGDEFGALIDYFKGFEDIKRRLIRVIHKISFIEDPTRIIRAIRFSSRYNFTIEKKTHHLILEAIEMGILDKLSWARLRVEFKYIFEDKNPLKGIKLLDRYNLLSIIHKNILLDDNLKEKLEKFLDIKAYFDKEIEIWLAFLLTLTSNLEKKALLTVFFKFDLNNKFKNQNLLDHRDRILFLKRLAHCNKYSEIYSTLNSLSIYTILLLSIEGNEKDLDKIKTYLFDLKKKIAIIKGNDLINLGIEPGKQMGIYLQNSFLIQLDLKNPTKEKILKKLKLTP